MPGASLSLTPLDWIICVGLLTFSIAAVSMPPRKCTRQRVALICSPGQKGFALR